MPLHVCQGIDSHRNYDKLTRIRVARCSVFNWTVWYFGSLSVIKMIVIPDVAHVLIAECFVPPTLKLPVSVFFREPPGNPNKNIYLFITIFKRILHWLPAKNYFPAFITRWAWPQRPSEVSYSHLEAFRSTSTAFCGWLDLLTK